MNLITNMVLAENQDQTFELIQKFFIKSVSDSAYLKKAEHDSKKIMQINF